MADLDKLYKENAYMNPKNYEFNGRFFTDQTYDEELRSLGEGQMSTVRLCKDFSFTKEEFKAGKAKAAPMVDSCYMIFKVNKITFSADPTISAGTSQEVSDEILKQFKPDTEVMVK